MDHLYPSLDSDMSLDSHLWVYGVEEKLRTGQYEINKQFDWLIDWLIDC